MTTDTNHFKTKLEEERAILLEELVGLGKKNPENGAWEPTVSDGTEADSNDLADRFEDYEGDSAVMATLEKRLADVTDALKKIQEGRFGVCEVGSEPIEPERLEANPSARTCMKHMEA